MRKLLGFAIAAFTLAVSPAYAELKLVLTQGDVTPLPIAIVNPGGEGQAAQVGRQIFDVVSADLERSGLFRPIAEEAFIEHPTGSTLPRFADWRQVNAQGLVTGSVSGSGDKIKIAFRLWDVEGEQQIAGKEFNTFANNWRRVAHLIADEIYKRITGENGYFDSRIVYVAESGGQRNRTKRLAIMDQDGENHKFLTDGRSLVLTPRFSPSSQDILYMSYSGRQPRVFLRDLQTGREESLGRFDGMSFAPRYSPDGSKMLMSIAKDGDTDIYVMNLRGRQMTQLTNDPGIDTSPSYSPDGSQIVFNSDRGGSQQLYVMDANGGSVQRISFGDGKYGTPVWSPRGDWIAFTKMKGGRFFIGIMRADGSGERMLTESFLDEGPSWSPNGRVIIFSRQTPSMRDGRGGTSKLYSVDITGRNLRQVPTPMDASDPAWSPLLPL